MIDQTKKLRRSEISIFCAFMTLVLAGLSLYGMVDDSALVPVMIKHPDMALLWYAVEGSGLLAAFAIAVGGLPIAWASARRIWLRARGEMWLLLVPVISAILVAAPPLAAI